MRNPARLLFVLLILSCALPAVCRADEFKLARIELIKPRHTSGCILTVELADTLELRLRGLAARQELSGDGMLFDFGEAQLLEMWMKNVHFPLDMLFVSEKGLVFHLARNNQPDSTRIISSRRPGRYVICIPAGEAERLDIRRGARMLLLLEAEGNNR